MATGSSQFFVDLLKCRFDVDVVYTQSRYAPEMPDAELASGYDCVVCWQVMPSNIRALSYRMPVIYVPMYDGETGNVVKWMRNHLQGIKAISFCKAETRLLEKAGCTPLEVQYYPEPRKVSVGDQRKAFLWNRGCVGESVTKMVLPKDMEIVVYNEEPKAGDDARLRYLDAMSRCGIYIAPRRLEGIGLGFLEAMANGKCVVAHDAPTMNEYIVSGKNGILVDFDSRTNTPLRLDDINLCAVGCAAYQTCVIGRCKWDEEYAPKILDYVESSITSYRCMTAIEKVKWCGLLPLHFLWDIKTFISKICSRRI